MSALESYQLTDASVERREGRYADFLELMRGDGKLARRLLFMAELELLLVEDPGNVAARQQYTMSVIDMEYAMAARNAGRLFY